MRNALLSATALAVLLVAVPATADEPVSEPCTAEEVAAADIVLDLDGETVTIPTPTAPSPYPLGLGGEPDPAGFQDTATDTYTVLLDVNPDFVSATVNVALAWAHTGDIDLDVKKDGVIRGESHSFNPQTGNTENASGGRVGHCETFEVDVRNYISTPGDITMTLTTGSPRAS